MTPVGGLRARLLLDSLQRLLTDGLTDMGWFEPQRSHRPIVFRAEPAAWDEAVGPNSLILTAHSHTVQFIEVGSNLTSDAAVLGVDLYAEGESLAIHLSGDIRDILRGRAVEGIPRGSFPILDYRMATPVPIGHAEINDVTVNRTRPEPNAPRTQAWFGIDAVVVDYYYDTAVA